MVSINSNTYVQCTNSTNHPHTHPPPPPHRPPFPPMRLVPVGLMHTESSECVDTDSRCTFTQPGISYSPNTPLDDTRYYYYTHTHIHTYIQAHPLPGESHDEHVCARIVRHAADLHVRVPQELALGQGPAAASGRVRSSPNVCCPDLILFFFLFFLVLATVFLARLRLHLRRTTTTTTEPHIHT